jgi:release factor glutamine methyltransferase
VTFHEAASQASATLIAAGLQPETAMRDATLLARHAMGWDIATWVLRRSDTADARFEAGYRPLIERRAGREPVAYIRGVQEFWGRNFRVTPAVLIPRPETELLIENATAFLTRHPQAVVADIGTGSGCIAITLALEHRSATVHATDVSEAALAVARENAATHGAVERVHFVHGPYLDDLPRPVDLIVTNPPYVAAADRAGLAPEVRDHEPAVALFGGTDGWREIRMILREATAALAPDGRLMMEIGYGQADHLEAEVQAAAGLALEEVREDLQGIPRVAIIRRQ